MVLGEGNVGAPEDCHRQRKKVGQFFSVSAEQPVIKNNRIEKGLLKRLQFSEILLREMITMFSVEV